MYYNARYYLPKLRRFISADTIVPNPGNSQDWNRYSYVGNNPINYNDPSGHLPSILAGAIVGAVVGVGIYAVGKAIKGEKFKIKEAAGAAAVGAVGGALIGSGVGIVMGATTMATAGLATGSTALGGAALITAGTSTLVGQTGYTAATVTAPNKEYDAHEMAIAAGVSTVSGPIDKVVGGNVTNGAGSVAQYALTELRYGRKPTKTGATVAYGSGVAFAAGGSLIGDIPGVGWVDELAVAYGGNIPVDIEDALSSGYENITTRLSDLQDAIYETTMCENPDQMCIDYQ